MQFNGNNKWKSQRIKKQFRNKQVHKCSRSKHTRGNSASSSNYCQSHYKGVMKRFSRISNKMYWDKYCSQTQYSSAGDFIDDDLYTDAYDESDTGDTPIDNKYTQYHQYKPLQKTKTITKKFKKNKQNNCFQEYWDEMQKDWKIFHQKSLKNICKTKYYSNGMKNSIHHTSRRLLREYFILCTQTKIANEMIHDKKKKHNRYKAFSCSGITHKLKTLCPQISFNIQTLRKTRSFSAKTLVFHGTDRCNIDSIIQNGLIVGGTKGIEMRNGSAYGNGIYCSPSIQTASGYSNGAIFVCSASNARKSGDIWVVPNETHITCCYVIRYNGGYLSKYSTDGNSNPYPSMSSNDIAIFIPSLGKLNINKKFRSKQRRFSNRNNKLNNF